MRTALAAFVIAAISLTVGCRPQPTGPLHDATEPEYGKRLPPGELALRKLTDPADIPDFTEALAHSGGLRMAIARSLNYMSKPSSGGFFPYGPISHAHAVASLKAFDELLARPLPPDAKQAELLRRFDVYTSVGWNGKGTVLYTGYYTPIFDASPVRTGRFRYPLYKTPPDLVKTGDGKILGRRVDGRIETFPTREQIERTGMLAGLELVWMADRVEAYVTHVQGSAKLRMPTGRLITVGYAANNGHDYESLGAKLVADKKLKSSEVSLQSIIRYFKAHPEQTTRYLWSNPRYVFFRIAEGDPRGSLNEPVTPLRSIATDKEIYPRACLAFIHTELPVMLSSGVKQLPYSGFVLDQDAGGAIRAPGRCDVYMGVGDEAGELAGRTRREGRLYYLFLKTPGDASR